MVSFFGTWLPKNLERTGHTCDTVGVDGASAQFYGQANMTGVHLQWPHVLVCNAVVRGYHHLHRMARVDDDDVLVRWEEGHSIELELAVQLPTERDT